MDPVELVKKFSSKHHILWRMGMSVRAKKCDSCKIAMRVARRVASTMRKFAKLCG